LAVARAAERTGVDLIDAEEEIERRQQPQQQRTVGHHLRLAVEKGGQVRGKQQHRYQQHRRDGHRQPQGRADTLLGPGRIAHAQVLPHEGGVGHGDGLDRQDHQLVHLVVRRPAGHTVRAEVIDIALHEHIGECGDGHLQRGGDAHRHDLPQHAPGEAQGAQLQPDAALRPHQHPQRQHGGHGLHGLLLVSAVGHERDLVVRADAQGEYAHHGFAVDDFAALLDEDLRAVAAGHLDQHGSGFCVQPVPIGDDDGLL